MNPIITYVEGDATDPLDSGGRPRVIAHIVNDEGKWGRGFVKALSARWPEPEEAYLDWWRRHWHGDDNAGFELGRVGFARVTPSTEDGGIVVANMIAQHGVRHFGDPRAVSYDALDLCLRYLGSCSSPAGGDGAVVHMPRIGAGLGGGDWSVIEAIINETLIKRYGVPVFVYDLPTSR